MSEQPHIKNGVERLRHRVEVLDGSPLMTVPPEVIREVLTRLERAEQAVARVREVIHQYDPDCLTCMCNSDGDCCKCTVADFQEALDGDTRG